MSTDKGKAKKANPQSSQKPTEGGSRIQPQSDQLPTDDQTRVLWCLVAGHSSAFKITVKVTHDVDDLKRLLWDMALDAKLKPEILPQDLTVWKLDGALKLKPAKTLADRLTSSSVPRRELEEPSETILDIFPEQPEKDHLHLFVELPVDQHPAKKARLSNDPVAVAASPFREAAWGKVYPRTKIVSPFDDKEYQCYDFTKSHHLDFLSLSSNHVLIRQEYEEAYTYLKGSKPDTPIIITGQPGIGKTLFLVDLLIRRLEERETTAIQFYQEEFLLFDGDGVQSLSSSRRSGLQIPMGAWALSDSNVTLKEPSTAFQFSPAKTILASFPAQTRWKEWQKQKSASIYLMDLWGKSELGALAVLLAHDPTCCLHLAATWGPSARQIMHILANPQDEAVYRSSVEWAVTKYMRNYNVVDLADANNLDFKEDGERSLSSKVFFVRPGESRRKAVLEVPTGEIWKLLTTAITAQSIADIIKFFAIMSSHGQTRAAAGWMFETHMHARLSMPGTEITLYDKNHNTKIISSAPRIPGPLNQLPLANPPFYWQPSEPKFPGIDSILCTGNDLYAFQATVSSRHKEAWQGLTKVSRYIPKGSKTWHLVFVGLTLDAVNSVRLKHPSDKNWAGVEMYGCELVPSKAFQDQLGEAMAATPQHNHWGSIGSGEAE